MAIDMPIDAKCFSPVLNCGSKFRKDLFRVFPANAGIRYANTVFQAVFTFLWNFLVS